MEGRRESFNAGLEKRIHRHLSLQRDAHPKGRVAAKDLGAQQVIRQPNHKARVHVLEDAVLGHVVGLRDIRKQRCIPTYYISLTERLGL